MNTNTSEVNGTEYHAFLNRVIDDGIAAARDSYATDPHKQRGAVEGFEACRGKRPDELAELLTEANRRSNAARELVHNSNEHDVAAQSYWHVRCYAAEVEWVCNVVSCALQNEGRPTIVIPTARAFRKAAEILGVRATEKHARS